MTRSPGREVIDALRLVGPLRRQIARLLPDDVRPGDLAALRIISADEAARVSDVAAHLHVGLPVASRQVRQLEDQGLVTRAVSPDDRRSHRLSLTASGRELQRRVEDALARSLDDVLEDWPAQDAVRLGELMARLHQDISRLPDARPMTLQETS